MALTKRERICLLRKNNWTLPRIAWAVNEEPAEVLRVLNEEGMPLAQAALKERQRKGHATALRLRSAGYSIDVIMANFYDMITREELERA